MQLLAVGRGSASIAVQTGELADITVTRSPLFGWVQTEEGLFPFPGIPVRGTWALHHCLLSVLRQEWGSLRPIAAFFQQCVCHGQA